MTVETLPNHIAIIMDGNSRWAQKHSLPRMAGYEAGFKAMCQIVEACIDKKIPILTLLTFDQEAELEVNPREDFYSVEFFLNQLIQTMPFSEKNIQLKIIGNRSKLPFELNKQITEIEEKTATHQKLKLIIAVHYDAKEEMTKAMLNIAQSIERAEITSQDVTPQLIQSKLQFCELPDPDFFIRTQGEQQLSNFLLWQLAYTELYFVKLSWPDFNLTEFEKALYFYANRERRFGYISEQLREHHNAEI